MKEPDEKTALPYRARSKVYDRHFFVKLKSDRYCMEHDAKAFREN